MKVSFLISLNLAALLVAGCSSTPKSVDHGPIRASTFNFVGGGTTATPDFADNRELVHGLIQAAITRNLADKGLTKVASGGDVVVAYLIILGNNASTEAINTYFGYGRDSSALHDKAHAAYTGSENPEHFEAGTLVVDFVDAKSHELLKRSYVTRPALRDATPEVKAENIQKAVDAVLKDVRISH